MILSSGKTKRLFDAAARRLFGIAAHRAPINR
jgi:hypothetical protein